MKKILILGSGGFIGGHLAKRLKNEGNFVRVVDLKRHEYFEESEFCDEFKTKYGFKCPVGVKGRNSDNRLYKEKMNWEPQMLLSDGIIKTFDWVNKQVHK
jgi:nucleoside-diphosphate-sugar epimerase